MNTVVKAGLAAAALLALSAVPASAQSGVRAGTLSCNIDPSVSFIVGSVRNMTCTFSPTRRSGKRATYTGSVRRLGLDVGFSGRGQMVWGVFAPTAKLGPGALRGTYVGASAGAAFGLGLGANALIGGSNNTIGLQPLSVEGQTGVNLALGVAGLTLQ